MKFTIRNNVFETNSSSMHSFSWVNRFEMDKLTIPNSITFETEDFGWSSELRGIELKANYLYTAAVNARKAKEFEEAISLIAEDLGFKYKFLYTLDNYIDHQSQDEARELIETLLSNHAYLINFLFRDDTDCIITGDCCDDQARKANDRIKIGGYDFDEDDY